jgi:O-antigen ligase
MFQGTDRVNRRHQILFLAIVALVAITPLGREATHPLILFTYRTLLLVITGLCFLETETSRKPAVHPMFLVLGASAMLLMLASVLANPGSHFDGVYRWYQFLLFGTAFVAMAGWHRSSSLSWKRAVLWSVIGIDVVYLIAALLLHQRPAIGPFVNQNYFASFLLVGFAAACAIALFEISIRMRIAAGACALFLYYGMIQAWSRGATISAMIVVVFAILRFSRAHSRSWVKLAAVAGLFLVIGAAASPVLIRKFLDRGEQDPYNYQRPRIWWSTLQMIGRQPALGVGLGQFFHVSKKFDLPVEDTVARYLKRPAIAHSEYLQLAAEAGLPAALLLLSLAGYLVFTAIKRASSCSAEHRVFHEAAILTAAGLGVHAVVDNNWTVPVMAAGLVAFSLSDCLPSSPWPAHLRWSPRLRAVLLVTVLLAFGQSTLVPSVAIYFNQAGYRTHMAGDLKSAESMYRLAAAIEPKHYLFLDNAGMAYFDMYRQSEDRHSLELAEVFFNRAMAASINAEEPRRHLENVYIKQLTGNIERDRPTHLKIVAVDRDLLRISPFDPFVRRNLAEALYNSGSVEEAERELTRALEIEPNYVPAYLQIADWYHAAGDAIKSERFRQKAMDIVTRFQNRQTSEPYEALLLGRPESYIHPQ